MFNNPHFLARCYYLIDSLYIRRIMRKQKWTEFLPVSLRILQRVVGHRRGPEVKRVLLQCNIIEAFLENGRESYQCGACSKSYRFTEQYQNVHFSALESPDAPFMARIINIQAEQSKKEVSGHEGKILIHKNVREINFNCEAARAFIERQVFINDDAKNWATRCVEVMESGDWQFKRDAQGRIYHPFENMPRVLRQFATHKGESLLMVDVSASHPCLAAMLYKHGRAYASKYRVFYKYYNLYGPYII